VEGQARSCSSSLGLESGTKLSDGGESALGSLDDCASWVRGLEVHIREAGRQDLLVWGGAVVARSFPVVRSAVPVPADMYLHQATVRLCVSFSPSIHHGRSIHPSIRLDTCCAPALRHSAPRGVHASVVSRSKLVSQHIHVQAQQGMCQLADMHRQCSAACTRVGGMLAAREAAWS
jgi:hypothetical protein